ncbi:MAG: PEP-CTERM sorting domain-containing protein, partial [Caulobacteraceae bacterium]
AGGAGHYGGNGGFGGGGGAAYYSGYFGGRGPFGGGGGGFSGGGGGAGYSYGGGGGGGSFFAGAPLVSYSGVNAGNGQITIDFLGSPVPEPAGWALMTLGLFGAGAVLRGRRKGRAVLTS